MVKHTKKTGLRNFFSRPYTILAGTAVLIIIAAATRMNFLTSRTQLAGRAQTANSCYTNFYGICDEGTTRDAGCVRDYASRSGPDYTCRTNYSPLFCNPTTGECARNDGPRRVIKYFCDKKCFRCDGTQPHGSGCNPDDGNGGLTRISSSENAMDDPRGCGTVQVDVFDQECYGANNNWICGSKKPNDYLVFYTGQECHCPNITGQMVPQTVERNQIVTFRFMANRSVDNVKLEAAGAINCTGPQVDGSCVSNPAANCIWSYTCRAPSNYGSFSAIFKGYRSYGAQTIECPSVINYIIPSPTPTLTLTPTPPYTVGGHVVRCDNPAIKIANTRLSIYNGSTGVNQIVTTDVNGYFVSDALTIRRNDFYAIRPTTVPSPYRLPAKTIMAGYTWDHGIGRDTSLNSASYESQKATASDCGGPAGSGGAIHRCDFCLDATTITITPTPEYIPLGCKCKSDPVYIPLGCKCKSDPTPSQ